MFNGAELSQLVYKGAYCSVGHLLGTGADFEFKNNIGDTLLMIAAQKGHISIVKLLFRQYMNSKNHLDVFYGQRDQHFNESNIPCLNILLKEIEDNFHIPVIMQYKAHIYSVLDYQNNEGMTSFLLAAQYGKADVAAWLLMRGADIEARSKRGKTFLEFAIERVNSARPNKIFIQLIHIYNESITLKNDHPNLYNVSYNDLTIQEIIKKRQHDSLYLGRLRNKTVIIKKINTSWLGEYTLPDDHGIADYNLVFSKYLHEINILAGLDSPFIVKLIGIFARLSDFSIITEHYTGGTLFNALEQDASLDLKKRLEISLDVAHGLLYLHKNGIIHADLKSLNVVLDNNKCAKIINFENSIFSSAKPNSSATIIKGTPQWQAPELFDEPNYPNESSDRYSYSIVLWELITKKHPLSHIPINKIPEILKQNERHTIDIIQEVFVPSIFSLIIKIWTCPPQDRPSIQTILKIINKDLEVFRTTIPANQISLLFSLPSDVLKIIAGMLNKISLNTFALCCRQLNQLVLKYKYDCIGLKCLDDNQDRNDKICHVDTLTSFSIFQSARKRALTKFSFSLSKNMLNLYCISVKAEKDLTSEFIAKSQINVVNLGIQKDSYAKVITYNNKNVSLTLYNKFVIDQDKLNKNIFSYSANLLIGTPGVIILFDSKDPNSLQIAKKWIYSFLEYSQNKSNLSQCRLMLIAASTTTANSNITVIKDAENFANHLLIHFRRINLLNATMEEIDAILVSFTKHIYNYSSDMDKQIERKAQRF